MVRQRHLTDLIHHFGRDHDRIQQDVRRLYWPRAIFRYDACAAVRCHRELTTGRGATPNGSQGQRQLRFWS